MKDSPYGLAWMAGKTKGVRLALAIDTLLVVCVPALQLTFAYFMKLFIDIATGSIQVPLLNVAICTTAVVMAGGFVMMVHAVLAKWIYGKMECNLRSELLGVIFSRRMIDLSKQHTGELLTKLTADTQTVSSCFTLMIDHLVGGACSALLATVALFFLNWKIAVLLLVFTPLLMFVMGAFAPRIQEASAKDKGNEEQNRSILQEALSRMMLIKTYLMQEKTIDQVRDCYRSKLKSGMVLGLWEGLAAFSGTLSGNVMSMVTLGLGSYFVLKGETTVGSLIMIVQLLNYIVTPVSKFPVAVAQVGQAIASSGRIGTICELPAEQERPAAAPVQATELRVRDVCFSYGGEPAEPGPRHLLDHVSLSFQKGRISGIAGKSGSGKSTLLKLLIGLYAPQSGTVELIHPSGSLQGEQITPQVSYVPPDDCLFSGSVADNIIMSERKPRSGALREAATDANAIGFIESLPQGFDTILGESGGTVSSGQAQRIAIARAIYKNAQIVVFDEPTANLDADSLEAFQISVKKLARDKICILVTHEEATMRLCDTVYVLENGRVREARAEEEPLLRNEASAFAVGELKASQGI